MKAQVLTGSKQEIVDRVARIEGEISRVIVFVHEPSDTTTPGADIFAEMAQFTVHQGGVDDSRKAMYRHMEGE